jgi:hypothetical protein
VARIRSDVEQIIRAEVQLVRLRVETGIVAAKAAGAGIACAVLLGLGGFGALVAGLIMLIATRVPAWAAAFAVGGGLVFVAAVVAAVEVRVLTRGLERAVSPAELEERYG